MEKLIELLLEYKPQRHYLDKPKGIYNKKYGIGWYKIEGDIGGWFSEGIIISKKFGFIKWLVENDKIDWNIADKERETYEFSELNKLIMLLSISDNPIQDLIDLLK